MDKRYVIEIMEKGVDDYSIGIAVGRQELVDTIKGITEAYGKSMPFMFLGDKFMDSGRVLLLENEIYVYGHGSYWLVWNEIPAGVNWNFFPVALRGKIVKAD